jgi:hypothetical protein
MTTSTETTDAERALALARDATASEHEARALVAEAHAHAERLVARAGFRRAAERVGQALLLEHELSGARVLALINEET